MEAKIEALEPRTSRALFFLLGNHVGNQHIASQRAEVTGSDGIVHRVLADYWFVSEQGDHERLLSTPRWISLVT
jgi:hypothetical protein